MLATGTKLKDFHSLQFPLISAPRLSWFFNLEKKYLLQLLILSHLRLYIIETNQKQTFYSKHLAKNRKIKIPLLIVNETLRFIFHILDYNVFCVTQSVKWR